MAVVKFVTAATFILHATSVLAIDLGEPIVGCTAVDCPSGPNSTSADCRVADRTTTVVGLANFDTSLVKDDFTWSQGVATYDNVDPNVDNDRVYEKNFYLGLPQGFDLTANATNSGYSACALFFTNVSDEVKFNGDDPATTYGTCNDALTADCVNALLKQATDAASSVNGTSRRNACTSLQSVITDQLVPECTKYANGTKWQGLEVRDLTGSDAAEPLTQAENSTSNCYPTLPKTNSLTYIAAFNTTGTALVASVVKNLFSITPILTVFFSENGTNASLFRQPEAQLTCLKPVDGLTDAANRTASSGSGDKQGAASNVVPLGSKFAVPSWLIILSVLVFVL